MGRVAKYKKIKSFDPYSKKNGGNIDLSTVGVWGLGDNGRKAKKRSRRAEMLRSKNKRKRLAEDGFDLPPSEKDEFDMRDLMGSIKKQKLINPIAENMTEESSSAYKIALKGNVATIPKTEQDERKVSRMLRLEKQVNDTVEKKATESHARIEGESKRAYARRTKAETREIIRKTAMKNPAKRQKKKEFLNNKKKSKRKGAQAAYESNEASDFTKSDGETFVTGERAVAAVVDRVRFGEQAERPPTFKLLPRGAKAKNENKNGGSKKKGMTNAQVAAENDAMEMMRRRVQAQYASIKAKRKRAGDFHL